MLDPFTLPFVQRGLVEVAVLAVSAGLIGTWIVLRGLAFLSHAVGTAAFPGLVLADGLSFSAHLGALGTAGVVAAAVALLTRRASSRYDSATGLVLVAALAVGVILASDVFHSGSNVDTLLFGSLLVIGTPDVLWAAAAGAVVLIATLVLGPRWLVSGFDRGAARAMGVRTGVADAVLVALVALVAIASLSAVGALLAAALLVVPAATTRLAVDRMGRWQVTTVLLAGAEGVVGLWASVQLNAPPGPAIAVLAGIVFAVVAAWRVLAPRLRAPQVAVGAAALLAIVLLPGGGPAAPQAAVAADRLPVVATTTQLGDFVRQVGGADVEVTQILRPNTDPHEYEPRPSDVRETSGAKLVVQSGNRLDQWMAKVIDESGAKPAVLTVAPAHTPQHVAGERSGPEASRFDPHWWHDPRNAQAAVAAIRDALSKADPAAKGRFAANARRYLAQLRALDAGIARCFASVPAAQRKLVTDHDAFGYFTRRYGITVVGAVIPSQSTQSQPSAGDVAKLVKLIRREHVKAVFPESSINPKLARAIARQTGASARYTLYGDTLGPAGSDGATYLAMERHNADAMMRGFTGGKRGCRVSS